MATCIATPCTQSCPELRCHEKYASECVRGPWEVQLGPTPSLLPKSVTGEVWSVPFALVRLVTLVGTPQAGRRTGRADSLTVPIRGQMIVLVCRWSGVAVLGQTLETLLLSLGCGRLQTGTSWPADREFIGLCPVFFHDTATKTRWSRSLGAEANALRAPLVLGEDPFGGSCFPPGAADKRTLYRNATNWQMGEVVHAGIVAFIQPFSPNQVDSCHA
jgi:hypothetical protein